MTLGIPPLLRHIALAAALTATPSCTDLSGPEPAPNSVRVLFIGNSLTYFNNLPNTVAALANSAGERPCYCVMVAYPDYALQDHYILGDALVEMEKGDFDFIVMQQGPSALPESRVNLLEGAWLFGQHFEELDAKGIMYGVWPSKARSFDFPNVHANYRAAADSIKGKLAPAGEAWQIAWQSDANLPLYAGDDFHPSAMGTYLAALTLFQQIYDRSPVGVQTTAIVDGAQQPWPLAIVQLLQQSAAAANAAEYPAAAIRR